MILPFIFVMILAASISDHCSTGGLGPTRAERPIGRLSCDDLDRLLSAGNLSAADEVRAEDRRIKECPKLATW